MLNMRSRVNALNKSKTPTADLFLASPYLLFVGSDLVTSDAGDRRERHRRKEREERDIGERKKEY